MVILMLTNIPDKLFACSCVGQRTVREELKHADAVLVGTIVAKELITLTGSAMQNTLPGHTTMKKPSMGKMTIARYSLLVQDVYKGKITTDIVIIYTGLGGSDCGIGFESGKKYIVYGQDETYLGQVNNGFKFPKAQNTFWTYSCLRTMPYSQSEIAGIEQFAKRRQLNAGSNDTLIFSDPDSPPVFKDGGEVGLRKFILKNMHYPEMDEPVAGKVYVGFTVDTLGNVTDVKIKRGLTPLADEEAIRIVKMLTFIPGTSYGRPVKAKMVLPISFTIE